MAVPLPVSQHSSEGSTSCEITITFPVHSHRVTIVNDDTVNPLQFKFNDVEDFGTLKAGEILDVPINTDTVIIDGDGNNVPYRVWGYS